LALVVGSIESYFREMTMIIRLIFAHAAMLIGLFGGVPVIYAASTTIQTAHDFSFTSIDGESLPLANFKGKAVLIVNTASMCGFTSQYTGLQDLWDSYRDRGLVVLGVPSDDFGGQELDTAAEVKSFCTINYNINFPMTDIVHVKGPAAHPYYKWVAEAHGGLAVPRWNFHKHLVDPDGRLVNWFVPTTGPSSSKLRRAIEKILP
jgi:glutathione peroxidase